MNEQTERQTPGSGNCPPEDDEGRGVPAHEASSPSPSASTAGDSVEDTDTLNPLQRNPTLFSHPPENQQRVPSGLMTPPRSFAHLSTLAPSLETHARHLHHALLLSTRTAHSSTDSLPSLRRFSKYTSHPPTPSPLSRCSSTNDIIPSIHDPLSPQPSDQASPYPAFQAPAPVPAPSAPSRSSSADDYLEIFVRRDARNAMSTSDQTDPPRLTASETDLMPPLKRFPCVPSGTCTSSTQADDSSPDHLAPCRRSKTSGENPELLEQVHSPQ